MEVYTSTTYLLNRQSTSLLAGPSDLAADTNGTLYKLVTLPDSVELHRANFSENTLVGWHRIGTITSDTGSNTDRLEVSPNGNTIAAIIGVKLYISVNRGVTWNLIPLPSSRKHHYDAFMTFLSSTTTKNCNYGFT
jgi:hypothetical protein